MEVNSEFAYILPNERKSKNVHFPRAGSKNKRHPTVHTRNVSYFSLHYAYCICTLVCITDTELSIKNYYYIELVLCSKLIVE